MKMVKENGIHVLRFTPQELKERRKLAEQTDRQDLAKARRIMRSILEAAGSLGAPFWLIRETTFNCDLFWATVLKAKRQMGIINAPGSNGQRWILPEMEPKRLLRSIIEQGGEISIEKLVARFENIGLTRKDLLRARRELGVKVEKRGSRLAWSLPPGGGARGR
jgi:hypothetical protein